MTRVINNSKSAPRKSRNSACHSYPHQRCGKCNQRQAVSDFSLSELQRVSANAVKETVAHSQLKPGCTFSPFEQNTKKLLTTCLNFDFLHL